MPIHHTRQHGHCKRLEARLHYDYSLTICTKVPRAGAKPKFTFTVSAKIRNIQTVLIRSAWFPPQPFLICCLLYLRIYCMAVLFRPLWKNQRENVL